jgi:hypothetical protein
MEMKDLSRKEVKDYENLIDDSDDGATNCCCPCKSKARKNNKENQR